MTTNLQTLQRPLNPSNPNDWPLMEMNRNQRLQVQSELVDTLLEKMQEQLAQQALPDPQSAQTLSYLASAIRDLTNAKINELSF